MSDYMDRYRAWKDTQVCIGCKRKCGSMEPGEESWVTEYLCTPCWLGGTRGEPAIMFDGYSGATYATRPAYGDGGST